MQPKNGDMPNSFSSLTCAIVPKENEMPRILNKSTLEKQIMLFMLSTFWVARADCSVAELTVRFNTKCYHATVANLLKMKKC